jgi:hypothetical protein
MDHTRKICQPISWHVFKDIQHGNYICTVIGSAVISHYSVLHDIVANQGTGGFHGRLIRFDSKHIKAHLLCVQKQVTEAAANIKPIVSFFSVRFDETEDFTSLKPAQSTDRPLVGFIVNLGKFGFNGSCALNIAD